jgi:hypothetical protein
MKAYRVVVTQTLRDDCGDMKDASFTEYHDSLKRAACAVARFDQPEPNRFVVGILIETIRIQTTKR